MDNIERRFWCVAELDKNVVDVEVEHFDPKSVPEEERDNVIEAYDVKLIVLEDWNYELDLPVRIAKKLYEELKRYFE